MHFRVCCEIHVEGNIRIVIYVQNHFFSYINEDKNNKYTFWLLTTTSLLDAKLIYRVHQFIDLLPAIELLTDGLIFIGSICNVILTSQCQDVPPILGLDERGYWNNLIDIWVERVIVFVEKMKVYNKTILDWVRG